MTEAPPRSNLSPDSSKWVQWVEDKITRLIPQVTEVSQTANRGIAATSFVQDQNGVQQGLVDELDSSLLDTQNQVDNVETIANDALGAITVAPTVPLPIDGMGGYILADGTEVSLDEWDDLTPEQQEGAVFVPSKPEGAIWDTAVTAETEATYSWTGTVNNSASIESIGGTELRRNLALNPRGANVASTWGRLESNMTGVAAYNQTVSDPLGVGTAYQTTFTPTDPELVGSATILGAGTTMIPVTEGQRVTIGMLVGVTWPGTSTDFSLSSGVATRDSGGVYLATDTGVDVTDLEDGWFWVTHSLIVPAGVAYVQGAAQFEFAATLQPVVVNGTASIVLVGADGTIPEHLDPADYFDGSTAARMVQTGTDITDTRYIWDGNEWRTYVIGEDVLDPEIIGNVNTYVANLAGSIVQVGPTAPVDPNKGTLWWETDSSGVKFKGLWYYNGTIWQSYTLVANDIIAANSISTPLLQAGALDAFQVTSPLIQSVATANRGIKWTGDVITGYTNTGAVGFQLNGGEATITGGFVEGSVIDGGLVRGAEFELKTEQAPSTSTAYSQNFNTNTTDGWVGEALPYLGKGTYVTTREASGGRTGGCLKVNVTEETVYQPPSVLSAGRIRKSDLGVSSSGEKTLTAWIKSSVSSNVSFHARYKHVKTGIYGQASSSETVLGTDIPANTWTKLSFVIPEGCEVATGDTQTNIQISISGSSPNTTFYVDDITVTTTYYGSQQIFIRQSDSGYPELVAYGSDGESVVVSTRTPDGYAGLAIYPADPQTTPPIIISQEGIGRVIYQEGTQTTSWEALAAAAAADFITISGITYQASGYVTLPAVTLTAITGGGGYTTINVTLPYTLPTGWTYAFTVDRSPMAWPITVNNADGGGTATQRIRLSAPSGTTITAGARIGWRITRAP